MDASATESQDVPRRAFWLCRRNRHGNPPRAMGFTEFLDTAERQAPIQRVSFWWLRNLMAIFARFPVLLCRPNTGLPLLIDLWLVLQSTFGLYSEAGPDVVYVYPFSSIKKRGSRRLAKLILDHSKLEGESSYEDCMNTAEFPRGIQPACIVTVHLGDSLQDHPCIVLVDHIGHTCMGAFLVTYCAIYSLATDQSCHQASKFWDSALMSLLPLGLSLTPALFGTNVVTTLALSKTSSPGSAVLLDKDLSLVLQGNRAVVEAIVEGSFGYSGPKSTISFPNRYLPVVLWESVWLFSFVLLSFAFICSQFAAYRAYVFIAGLALAGVSLILPTSVPRHASHTRITGRGLRFICLLFASSVAYIIVLGQSLFYSCGVPPLLASALSNFLLLLLQHRARAPNYPVQTTRFLDAIGHPRMRKWGFATPAAATTFQCLVVCHGIPRPIRTIDIAAFLDLLIPDQTPVWVAWKNRVAHHIVFEADIDFAAMVPTFPDERQKELKDLLDQAQSAYEIYKDRYDTRT